MRTTSLALGALLSLACATPQADPLPPEATYRPLPTVPLDVVRRNDEAAKPAVQRRQKGYSRNATTCRTNRFPA